MPNEFSGTGGALTGISGIQNVKSFTVHVEVDTGETINFDSTDNWVTTLQGAKRFTVSIVADMSSATAPPAIGATGTFTGTAVSGKTWSGAVIVDSIDNEVAMSADAVEVSFTCKGTLALTAPT